MRRLTVLMAAAALSSAIGTQALARGGAPWLDSPGYQRALAESRKKPKPTLQQQESAPPLIRRKKKTSTQ